MKKCMDKIENMPLQISSIFSRPWQMSQSACFSSKILCVVSCERKPRACQKLGVGPGVGKCPAPGQRKSCKCPTPGLKRRANTPQHPKGGGGGGGAGRSWNWLMHNGNCYVRLRKKQSTCFGSIDAKGISILFHVLSATLWLRIR